MEDMPLGLRSVYSSVTNHDFSSYVLRELCGKSSLLQHSGIPLLLLDGRFMRRLYEDSMRSKHLRGRNIGVLN